MLNDFCKACDLSTKIHKLPIKVINDIKIDCLEFLCENFAYQIICTVFFSDVIVQENAKLCNQVPFLSLTLTLLKI